MLKGNLLVAQGGGPTAVINQTLAGVVFEAWRHDCIDRIYGSLHGVEGIYNENFVELTGIAPQLMEDVARTPGSALLSTRVKPDAAYCKKMFESIKKHNIRYLAYIGGNDSSDTVRIVAEEAEREGYELSAIHVPKTIDNDLVMSDHTPGYGSAARYVASAFAGVDFDNRSLGGVYIGVVMGRHAGFLTAASALGRADEESGPHLIYLPERVFDIDRFLADVKKTYDYCGRCVVAVSEGIADADGTPIVTKLQENVERDAHGNVQLSGTGALGDLLAAEIKSKLNIGRVRADTLGYMQRSFLGVVSDTDAQEARDAGAAGIAAAVKDGGSFSIAIKRKMSKEYGVEFVKVGLSEVAAKTRLMPDNYISESGNDVTEDFIEYATPLIGSGFVKGTALVDPSR